ncbi:MAG: leucine-rich repeat protein [Prevotella sp.]|nr:leucine-rich repeat protein [Prevotella sp.]
MKRNNLLLILLLLMTVGVQTVRAGVPDDMKYQMVNSYDNTTWDGFSLWDGVSMMNYVDENGLIYITNAAQLAKYAYDLYNSSVFSGRNVCLDCNIDLGGYKFQIARNGGNAYGTGDDMVCFDGQNHIIRNGKAFSESANLVFSHYNGLFSEIKCARIQKLIVDNYTIEIGDYDDRTDRNACGIICGSADICTNRPNSVISNCRVMNSSVTGDIHYAGGIIGYGACDIYDCAVINSTIRTLDDTAGGIAGGINTLEINKTKISGNRVINCSVTAKDDHAGGLIGFIQANLTIEKNYVQNSTVKIEEGDHVGGLVGRMVSAGTEGYYSFTICKNWVDATVSGNGEAVKGAVIGKYDIHNTITNVAYSNYWNQSKCNLDAVGNDGTNAQTYEGMTAQQMTNEMSISGFTNWAHVYPMQQDQTTSDIVVTTAEQLREISDKVKIGYTYEGRTIRLANDIDVSNDANWEPIGCASADNSQIHPFMGRFDGQGHTISGLKTTGTSYDYRGLFGLVINAHISNVQIAGPNISTNGKYVGGAVGWVYGGSCYVGQVMVNSATITARSSAGGVMGRSSNDAYSTIEDCQVWGTSKVSASQDDGDTGADGWSGGIVGNIHEGQIMDCGSTAEIYGKKTGLVGGCEHAIAITRCYAVSYNNTNLVSVGMNNATITDCPATVTTGEGMKSTLGTEKWYYFSNGDRYPIPSALKIYVDDTGIVVDNGVVYEANYDGGNISSYDVIGYQGRGGAVEIPDDINGVPVDWVYRKAFSGNETITSITIGNNVRACYFEDLPNLTSLTLGSSVGSVSTQMYSSNPGREMIKKCPKLTTISVNENNANMIVVDNLLYSKWTSIANPYSDAWELLRCPVKKAGELELPSSIKDKYNNPYNVETVSKLAFEDCNLLTGIIMPETLRDGAQNPSPFNNNTALQYLDLRKCTNWTTEWNTNRGADATGFFTNVPENTLIYLPKGHTLADSKYGQNVIIGNEAKGTQPITLTDGVDFCPKTDFTAPNGVTNDRILVPYAEQDGDNIVSTPRGYTVCLPYALTLSDANVKVYKPSTSAVEAGVTTITFEEVEGGNMEVNKPYYVVVSSGTASLSTTASVSFTTTQTGGTNSGSISGYEFKGTLVKIPNAQLYDVDKPTYILQSDSKWHKVPNGVEEAFIGSYRAYFQATSAGARELNMTIDDGEITDIKQIRTIDADGTEHYYDLNGRLLPGKPKKGVYIWNGRKYVSK